MRPVSFASLVLVFLAVPLAAHAQPVRPAPVGTHVDWSYARDGQPVRYQAGDVRLTVRAEAGGEGDPATNMVRPVLTVAMPGYAPVDVQGSETAAFHDHRLTIGRWDAERPYVLFQSYTGGAHCCNQVQAVIPEDGRLRVVDLGEWDGGPSDALPTDVDGDGRLDFVFTDDSFLYLFASYAESFAPPLILNIVDGRTQNVSDRPGFRPLFQEARTEARTACLNPDSRFVGASPNGACAAYVAAAARVGRFDEAWAEMLRSFDWNSNWELPTDCRAEFVNGQCPPSARVTFEDYPSALRHFLIAAGYIAK